MDPDLIKKIPEFISKNDAKHFHVALVKIFTREGQVKNDVSINVQQYHPNGFEKIKKSFRFHGFNKLVIVHDPTQPVTEAKEPAKLTKVQDTGAKTPEGDQNAGKKADADSGKGNEGDQGDQTSPAEQLEKEYQFAITGNKAELVDFAEKKGIDLTKASNNDERKEAITGWFNAEMEKLSGE